MQEIGKRIKALRERNGIKQSDLAKQLHLSQPDISRIESGKKNPDIDTIVALQSILNTTVQEIITDTHPENATVSDELGLSDASIRKLKNRDPLAHDPEVINALLSYPFLMEMLYVYLFSDSFSELHYQNAEGISAGKPEITISCENALFSVGPFQPNNEMFQLPDFKPVIMTAISGALKQLRTNIRKNQQKKGEL